MQNATKAVYYAARLVEEQTMSVSATDPRAAAAHADMALRYDRFSAGFAPHRALQRLPGDLL